MPRGQVLEEVREEAISALVAEEGSLLEDEQTYRCLSAERAGELGAPRSQFVTGEVRQVDS